MCPKKGRRPRNLEVSTDSVPAFKLGYTAADIHRGGKRGRPERGRKHNNSNRGWRRQGERRKQERKKHSRKRRAQAQERKNNTETEAVGGEAGPSQSQYKKGHMTNIYLTDSDKKAIVDFVKDHKELYDKIDKHFKD